MAKKFEPKRTELQGLNTEIDNLKKQLNTQGDKMNEEARANLVKSIETKQKSLQRSAEDAQNEFQQQQNEVAQRIFQKMAPVIDKYAKENGLHAAAGFLESLAAGSASLGDGGRGCDQADSRRLQCAVRSACSCRSRPAARRAARAQPGVSTGTAPKPAAHRTPPKQ